MKNVMLSPLWCIVLLCVVGPIASTQGLDIVRDGRPCAEIVVDRGAHRGIHAAAQDLQEHLEKISDARLNLVHAPSNDAINRIYVGENQYTSRLGYQLPEFSGSGYDILIGDTYAVLSGAHTFFPPSKFGDLAEFQAFMGEKYSAELFTSGRGQFNESLGIYDNDDIGAWYAVSALLERLGVRFYAPYEDGTIFPKLTSISLKPGRETRQAAFDRRQWWHSALATDRDGVAWLKRLKCGTRTGIVCNHTLRTLICDPETRVRHPSWYAEESPGRLFPGFRNQGGVPRYTDPDFQSACVDWARKLFDTYPTLSQVTLGAPEDANDPYDWRDRAVYQTPGIDHQQAYANMMWDFHVAVARELKKSHPDKGVIWWCLYNNRIPTNIDPDNQPDNILCRMEAVPPSAYALDDEKKAFFDGIRSMFSAFKPRDKSQQWEWWLDYWWPTSPRYPEFFMQKLQQARQEQRRYFDGFFMEVAPDSQTNPTRIGEVPISHLMMYVNCKLLWDPDLDLDALLDEYYKLWFGPAEKEMRAFHEYAEKVWLRPGSRSVSEVNGFLKREDVPKYFELLEAARARTNPGTVYHDRIAALENSYAGLKTIFEDRIPRGQVIRAEVLPNDAQADGDFAKYASAWLPLKDLTTGEAAAQNRTEFTVALTQNKQQLFVAVRCAEANMEGLVETTKVFDTSGIFRDDHVTICVNTPEKNWFEVTVNPAAAVYDECRDLEVINRVALPILWTPGTKAVVKKHTDRWELEVAIPTGEFGHAGSSPRFPWGINVRRVRRAGGDSEQQALTPPGPSEWAQLAW